MKRTLIRYKTKPDMADSNAALVAGVFEELKATKPVGVRYLTLRLDDDSFVHSSRPKPTTAPARCPNWRLFRPFRAGFANVAPNHHCFEALQSSAIIGCWMSRRPGMRRVAGDRVTLVPDSSISAADIDSLVVEMRPRLHRYCARMVGSVIDGEDVLQDALIKAVESFASAGPIGNPEGWLFQIAHNTALDFLRRRSRQEALRSARRWT